LVLKDTDKAEKLKQSLPPSMILRQDTTMIQNPLTQHTDLQLTDVSKKAKKSN
jgi:hypothetical protein